MFAEPGDELRSLVVDEHRAGSLAYDARRLLDAAYAVRDQLSNDTWLVIGSLERDLLGSAVQTYPRGIGSATLSSVLQALLALAGLQGESMVRDPGLALHGGRPAAGTGDEPRRPAAGDGHDRAQHRDRQPGATNPC